MAGKQMALSLLVNPTGSHIASWLHPETQADASTDIGFYRRMAQLAERGKFDLFFIADTPAARTVHLDAWSRFPMFMNVFEPLTLLGGLAGATTRIGLGATASTSFYEPYAIARQFATLDHLTEGRAAWNVVTSANDFAARNFGLDKLPPHAERYDRAREFVRVVQALWDGDAPVRHAGKFFRVQGTLNVAPTPQGRPVIIQAGASDTGRDFAAETAEVVFSSDSTLEGAKRFHDDLKARMAQYGRTPDQLKVMAGMPILIADSAQQAEDRYQALQELIHPDVGRMRLGNDLEADLSSLPVDEPIPEDRIPKSTNQHKAYFDHIVHMIRVEKLTLRQLYMRYERGNKTLKGTPEMVADTLEQWFTAGACDGFMLMFNLMPTGLADFVEKVVPLLQKRGIFKQDYAAGTLRGHLGLLRPGAG